MSAVRVLVTTGFGLNCDYETAYAFELAGATAERMHINSLIAQPERLSDFHILAFVGGFSWGDDHGAGVLFAQRMKTNLGERLADFMQKGGLAIGICNGFQAVVNLGLLPGFDGDYAARQVALTANDCGNFRDDWVTLSINPDSPCVWTRGMGGADAPVRHGEGKFVAEPEVLERLVQNNQVVCTYAMEDGSPANGRFPQNPNGSIQDIAGICDPTGRVFGLMPHPEAYNHPTNHPLWTRKKEAAKRAGRSLETTTEGIQMLNNAVNYVKSRQEGEA